MPTLPCRKRPPSHTNGTIPSKTTTKRTPHSYGLSRLSATGGVFFYSASEKFFPRSAPPSIKAAPQSLLNPRTPHHLLRLPRVHRRVSCVSCVSRIASAAFPIFGFFFKTRLRGRQATARPQRLRFLRQTQKWNRSILVYPLAPIWVDPWPFVFPRVPPSPGSAPRVAPITPDQATLMLIRARLCLAHAVTCRPT